MNLVLIFFYLRLLSAFNVSNWNYKMRYVFRRCRISFIYCVWKRLNFMQGVSCSLCLVYFRYGCSNMCHFAAYLHFKCFFSSLLRCTRVTNRLTDSPYSVVGAQRQLLLWVPPVCWLANSGDQTYQTLNTRWPCVSRGGCTCLEQSSTSRQGRAITSVDSEPPEDMAFWTDIELTL